MKEHCDERVERVEEMFTPRWRYHFSGKGGHAKPLFPSGEYDVWLRDNKDVPCIEITTATNDFIHLSYDGNVSPDVIRAHPAALKILAKCAALGYIKPVWSWLDMDPGSLKPFLPECTAYMGWWMGIPLWLDMKTRIICGPVGRVDGPYIASVTDRALECGLLPAEKAEALIEDSYLAMLEHPMDLWRINHQQLLGRLRDAIAAATGESIENVQNRFEACVGMPEPSRTARLQEQVEQLERERDEARQHLRACRDVGCQLQQICDHQVRRIHEGVVEIGRLKEELGRAEKERDGWIRCYDELRHGITATLHCTPAEWRRR